MPYFFVYYHNASLLISLDEVEDCHILRFDTSLSLKPRSVDLDGFEMAGEDGVFYPAFLCLHSILR
ncbi:MAG: hypothetical protein IKW11_06790 [Bacteroidales bacterium]|nr:hypothetical protein [Bacteroidales bacterium]